MVRKEFEDLIFEEVVEKLNDECDDNHDREAMLDYSIHCIREQNLFLALHVIEALNTHDADWFRYDFSMGTLETPSPIVCKEDLEDFILEDEEEKDRFDLYAEIVDRAECDGLIIYDRTTRFMDIESADKKFNLRLKDWLAADKFNFAHDWYGIMNNIVRDTYPATDFGLFVPRFAGRSED